MMQNIMLAGSILKFLSGICTGSTNQPVVNGSNDFKTIINKSMKKSLKADLSGNAAQTKTFNHNKNDKQVYLEALRKGLLAKGKSLDKIYLKDSDMHTLNHFLNQCGYNKIEANKCIEKLLENNPDGRIKLSDLFAEIETHLFSFASMASGKNSNRSVDLEPAVIPKIDSALKDLGLSLKDADNILNASRSPSGGLDLNKLIVHLKTMENRGNKGIDKTEEIISAEKFFEKHQELGLKITPDKETGQISINGFIAALEQFRDGVSGKDNDTGTQEQKAQIRHSGVEINTAQNQDNGRLKKNISKADGSKTISEHFAQVKNSSDKLPMDSKAPADRVIKRAGAPSEHFGRVENTPDKLPMDVKVPADRITERLGAPSEHFARVEKGSDKLPMDVQASIDRIIERAVAPDEQFKLKLTEPSLSQIKVEDLKVKNKTGETSHIFQSEQVAESVKKPGIRTSKHDNESVRNTDSARQESLDRISDLNEKSAYKKDPNPNKDSKDLKSKTSDIIQDGNPSVKFEALQSASQSRSNNIFMPAYTAEQLGKQISRSVARGDRIINLHLTPPELGSVKLSMEIKDSILHLKIVAESSAAKEVLLNNSHDLKTVLADQGIKLERLDIQVESNPGNALADLNKGFNQEHRQSQETGGGLFSDGDIKEDISSGVLSRAAKDYLVDLTA